MRAGVRVAVGVVALHAIASPPASAGVPAWSDLVELAPGAMAGGVGIDGEGSVTATWWSPDTGRAFVATRPAGASALGEPLDLGTSESSFPQVAVNEAGAAAVVWKQGSSTCSLISCTRALWLRMRPSSGADFGPAVLLDPGASEAPSLALNQRGQVVVAWATVDRAVKAAQGSVHGVGQPREIAPAPADGRPMTPTAAIGEGGAAMVAWPSIAQRPEPLRASYRSPGGQFGPPEDVPGDASGAFGPTPAVVVDPRGTATVAFTTGFGGTALTVRAPRGGFSAPRPLEPGGAVSFRQDAAGNQLAFWTAGSSGYVTEVEFQPYASVRRPGGDWSAPYPILPRNSFPDLGLDGRGNAVALFTVRGAGQRLRAATLTRFDVLERPQELNAVATQIAQIGVNMAGAAVALVTEYRDRSSPNGGAVALITQRPADEAAARVSVAAALRPGRVRLTARCDEICRLRARVGPRSRRAGAAGRSRPLTLQARRRGRMSVRLGRAARTRLRRGRAVTLRLRATDAAGNVRIVRRRIAPAGR